MHILILNFPFQSSRFNGFQNVMNYLYKMSSKFICKKLYCQRNNTRKRYILMNCFYCYTNIMKVLKQAMNTINYYTSTVQQNDFAIMTLRSVLTDGNVSIKAEPLMMEIFRQSTKFTNQMFLSTRGQYILLSILGKFVKLLKKSVVM